MTDSASIPVAFARCNADSDEAGLFAYNLALALETLCPKSTVVMEPRPVAAAPILLERTA